MSKRKHKIISSKLDSIVSLLQEVYDDTNTQQKFAENIAFDIKKNIDEADSDEDSGIELISKDEKYVRLSKPLVEQQKMIDLAIAKKIEIVKLQITCNKKADENNADGESEGFKDLTDEERRKLREDINSMNTEFSMEE